MDVATQMRPTKPEPRREAFDHLSGARSLGAFWIVCAHYLPRRSEASFNGAIFRVNVAVCFFVVASGFVTHWAYGSKDFTAWSDLLRFYVRRLGRVIATFWIALVWAAYLLYRDGADLSLPYLLRCAIFLEQWFQWCCAYSCSSSSRLVQAAAEVPQRSFLVCLRSAAVLDPVRLCYGCCPDQIDMSVSATPCRYPMTRKLLFTAEEKYGGGQKSEHVRSPARD